jgi:hypothetical protein
MTLPAPETIEREQAKRYVTDAEMIRRMGVPEKLARPVIRELDETTKPLVFPKNLSFSGTGGIGQRWKRGSDAHEGLNMDTPQPRRVQRHG